MSESNQILHVRVLGFKTTYERLPVKGGPLDDNLDEKGYKLDAKGKRVMENFEVDWVSYAPSHSPVNTVNEERVKHLVVTDAMLQGDVAEKTKLMALRWQQIEPAYRAWKAGHDIPINGTPLGAWAGVTSEKAEVLRRFSIRTVEEVRDLTEGQMDKIQLPGMRDLRKQAGIFLLGKGAADAAAREADRDNEIAALKAQLNETQERFSAAMDLLEEKTNPKEPTIDELRAELDELGISYHHKAGVSSLKALLAEAHKSEAA